jgi:ABC-type uncharacterized transport system substrate-binding protein
MRSRGRPLALLAFLAGVPAAHAASPAVRPAVAVVLTGASGPYAEAFTAIRRTLESGAQPELLTFDLEGRSDNASTVRDRVRDAHPSLIVTVGTLATSAILAEPAPAPVVFSMVLYPEQSGFLPARGRAVTGATLDIPLDEQFATLRRLLPAARRVGVVYDERETGHVVDAASRAASRHGFELTARAVSGAGDVPRVVDELLGTQEALWMVADSVVLTQQTTSALLLAALRRRIPVFGLSTAHVRAGALTSLSCDYADVGAQTGELALRVLKGEPAGDIEPTAPRKVGLAVNLRTAEHIGLTLGPDVERDAAVVVR